MWYFAGVLLVPQNRVWFVVIFVFTCLAFAVVLMRLYSRVILTRLVGFEDWLIFLSMVSNFSTRPVAGCRRANYRLRDSR